MKVIPASTELEAAVLGTILTEIDAVDVLLPLVNQSMFFDTRHKIIYQCIAGMVRKGSRTIDFQAVGAELEASGRLRDAGGRGYLAQLIAQAAPTVIARDYIKRLGELATKRQLIRLAQHIVAHSDELDAEELLQRSVRALNTILEKQDDGNVYSIADFVDEWYADFVHKRDNPDNAIRTGFKTLDELHLFKPGNLIVLAARPGMGKSALAVNLAHNLTRFGNAAVVMFSLEMSKESLLERLLSIISRIPSNLISNGSVSDTEPLDDALAEASILPFYIDDTPALSPSMMMTKLRILTAKGVRPDLVIVDYLQLMNPEGVGHGNRVQEVTYLSGMMKQTAREFGVPVLVLSQLRRAVEDRENKRPLLSDLRESGAIEQDADAVIFLHREEYYNKDTERLGICDVIVAKNRHGATCEFPMEFVPEISTFREVKAQEVHLNEIWEGTNGG